jgi:hypothetical protein
VQRFNRSLQLIADTEFPYAASLLPVLLGVFAPDTEEVWVLVESALCTIPLFEAELTAYARAVRAGATKQIVLVLDRGGWHTPSIIRMASPVARDKLFNDAHRLFIFLEFRCLPQISLA